MYGSCILQHRLSSMSTIANLISSTQKSFNPQRYLYAVHADTSYDDLCVGVDRLKASIDQRSSALKVLVQNNFDRFVSAKNVIDCKCFHSMILMLEEKLFLLIWNATY